MKVNEEGHFGHFPVRDFAGKTVTIKIRTRGASGFVLSLFTLLCV